MKLHFVLLMALALPACSKNPDPPRQKKLSLEERDEKLCQASITKDLINPETVQFFEFNPIKEGDPTYRRSVFEDLGARGVRQYRFRFKAASKVGLLTTSINLCSVYKTPSMADEGCICVDRAGI